MTTIKSIGFKDSLPVSEKESFIEFETEKPTPTKRQLLVKVTAVAINPVDYKIRQNSAKQTLDTPKVIGWDAVGVVEEVGSEASLFKKGDEVYYAGEINKPGCNTEFQLVDERIVGKKPTTLTTAEAAAMPLTSITAWEILFDRIRISSEKDRGKTILIIGGAGGVGSIAIQLAKKVAGLTVLATASREESKDWCKQLGADYVVNHKDLINEVKQAGFETVDFIVDFVDTNQYWEAFVKLIKPQGHVASISDPTSPIALEQLKGRSVSFSWEFMFTRSMLETEDMIAQHHLLNQVADLLDNQTLKTTLSLTLKGFTPENFRQAHKILEDGKTIGKVVIEY